MVLIGLLFAGFRRMLVVMYDSMAGLTIGFLSFPHLLAYFFFFLSVDLVKYFVIDRIISLLIKLKNPPSD